MKRLVAIGLTLAALTSAAISRASDCPPGHGIAVQYSGTPALSVGSIVQAFQLSDENGRPIVDDADAAEAALQRVRKTWAAQPKKDAPAPTGPSAARDLASYQYRPGSKGPLKGS